MQAYIRKVAADVSLGRIGLNGVAGLGYLAERILVLGLEFHQLLRSAGTQRRRGFRSGDLQLAVTFLHGENASEAAAMVIDHGIPQDSIDPGFSRPSDRNCDFQARILMMSC
jgi:hypothetical protein